MQFRPLRRLKIEDLERNFDECRDDADRLHILIDELNHRRLPRAKVLNEKAQLALSNVRLRATVAVPKKTSGAISTDSSTKLESRPTETSKGANQVQNGNELDDRTSSVGVHSSINRLESIDYRPWYERNLRWVIVGLVVLGIVGAQVGGIFVRTPTDPGPPLLATGVPPDFREQPRNAERSAGPAAADPRVAAPAVPADAVSVPPRPAVTSPTQSQPPTSEVSSSQPKTGERTEPNKAPEFGVEVPGFPTGDELAIGKAAVAAAGLGLNEVVQWKNEVTGRSGLVSMTGRNPAKQHCYDARVTRLDEGRAKSESLEICF